MLCFKFHQNCTINEEFDFWGVKVLPRGGGFKFKKVSYKAVVPHQKFQHSSSIRKCLQIGGIDSTFWGVKGPPRVAKGPNFKIRESLVHNDVPNIHRKFQHSSSLRKS